MTIPIAAERWSDWACAGGVSTGALVVLEGSFGDALDNTDACQLTYIHDPRVAVGLRDVIRITDGTGTVREYRVQSLTKTLADGRRTLHGISPLADLTTAGLVRTLSGGVAYYNVGAILTPTQIIDTYVLANLAADGITWLARGTVSSTTVVTLTAPTGGWTRLEWLRQLANLSGTELRLRRNGETQYLIDLVTAVGSSAAAVRVALGKNLTDLQASTDDGDLATAVTVQGTVLAGTTVPAGIGENAWTIGTISGAGPYWVPLSDPAGGAAPIAFASQFGTATGSQAAYLLTNSATTVQITDSRITPDYAVSVAATAGLTAGDLVQLVADSSATRLNELRSPNVSRLHRVDTGASTIGGSRNLLRNGEFATWTNTTTLGTWYNPAAGRIAEYPRSLPTTETAMVCDGAATFGASSFTFRGVTPGRRFYRREQLSIGGQINYVADYIVVADETGRGTINLISTINPGAADGAAVTWYLINQSGFTNMPSRPASFPNENGNASVVRLQLNSNVGVPADNFNYGIASAVTTVKYVAGALATLNVAAGITVGVGTLVGTVGSPTTLNPLWLPTLQLLQGSNNTVAGTVRGTASVGSALNPLSTNHITLSTSTLLSADGTYFARVTAGYVEDFGNYRHSWQGVRWVTLWLGPATGQSTGDAPAGNQLWQRGNRALAARSLSAQQLKVSFRDLSAASGYSLTREQLTLGGSIVLDDLGVTVRVVALTYNAIDPADVQVLLDSRPTRLVKFLAETL